MVGCLGMLGQDCRKRGCWSAVFYPKVAPEWYRRMVGGLNMGDVHQQPVPEGSLLLLGYVSLAVPELEPVEFYWLKGGIEAGRSLKQRDGEEIRANVGPSQFRFPLAAGAPAQRWPGEITLWVDDIRQTTDAFNMLGRTLGVDIVNELTSAEAGGEFMLKLKSRLDADCYWPCREDPFRRSIIKVTEAPLGYAEKIRKIGHDVSMGDEQYPPKVFNPLAISDVKIFVPSREVMLSVVRFYQHYLLVPMKSAGPTEYQVQLHFGPGDGLHQTVTFVQDPSASFADLGSICVYVAEKTMFARAFARCKVGGILGAASPTDLHEAERNCEFQLSCIQDPGTKTALIPLQHVVRLASHPECPLHMSAAPATPSAARGARSLSGRGR